VILGILVVLRFCRYLCGVGVCYVVAVTIGEGDADGAEMVEIVYHAVN
jgi:hypothetical protein